MILRDVIVGSERERLRSWLTPEITSLPTPAERHERNSTAERWDVESVCRWLETQAPEVRAACAAHLASDIQLLTDQACEEGRELGRSQARQEALDSVRSSLGTLAQAAAACEQAFTRECAQLAESCADIVAEAFRKVAGPNLLTREAALGAVLEVLKRAKDERELTIRVSPQDLPLLESQKSVIQEALGSRQWSLCADPRVALGGCLVDSSLGTLDGRLEIQLQELWETLRASKSARVEDR